MPPFDVADARGRRRRIHPARITDTVNDLARALDLDPFTLTVDGRPHPPHRRLVDVEELRAGATIGSLPHAGARTCGPAVMEVAITAGPACTPWRGLPAGRHLVGRAADADLVVDDPFLERHTGFLEVDASGTAHFLQLAGAVPARCAGRPSPERLELRPGMPVEIGVSRLEIRPLEPRENDVTETIAGDPWHAAVRRLARVPPPRPVAVRAPPPPASHRPPAATALWGALVGVVGSLAIGVLLGNLFFAAFALIGSVATFGTWVAGVLGAHRRTRRERTRYDSERAEFRDGVAAACRRAAVRHRSLHAASVDALTAAHDRGPSVWQDTIDPEAGFAVTVGWGAVSFEVPVDGELEPDLAAEAQGASVAPDAPVPLWLRPGTVVAIRGPEEPVSGLVRSFVLQAATWNPPSRLAVEAPCRAGWEWVAWLPHCADPEAFALRLTTRLGDAASAAAAGTTVLMLREEDPIPEECVHVVEVGATGRATVVALAGPDSDAGRTVRVGSVSEREASAAARRLAALREVAEGASRAGLPAEIALETLFGAITPESIAAGWGASDGSPRTPVGMTHDGPIAIDLVADGPHALVAGTTGSGKSAFLQTVVLGLAARVGPDDLNFVLADYKGGATFDVCARLPHVAGVLTDLDEGVARRALVGLDAEVLRRERMLRDAGAADFDAFRRARTAESEPLPRLVIVVDEFAGLAKDVPDVLNALVAIAQRGRSLGVHLVLATQRPAGVVSEDVRANTDLRIALRVNAVADARDVVDDPAPARFARELPGRIALRSAGGDLVVAQSARIVGVAPARRRLTVDPPDERRDASQGIVEWVDMLGAAADLAGSTVPRRAFLEPLPHPLDPGELLPAETGRCVVGLVDQPNRQRRHPLAWGPGDGPLALIGSVGSGLTSTLLSLCAAACGTRAPGDLELVVIDAGGDDRLDALAGLAHCAGVIRPHETERMARAMRRLSQVIDRRRARPGGRRRAHVLVVDGFTALRSGLAGPESADVAAQLDRILRDGPAVGACAVLADHGSTLCSAAYPLGARWVFEHCDDNAAALVPGRPRSATTVRPGRLWVASGPHRGSEAQVACGAPGLAALPPRSDPDAVPAVSVLPGDVPSTVVSGRSRAGVLAIGIDADDLEPATIDVAAGENLLVVGGARRGVSNALAAVAAAWSEVHGLETVGRWSEVAAAGEPHAARLVLVDDAHRIDHDEDLARLLDDRSVTVCAGARADAVRSSYGHWTRSLAAAGRGLILTGGLAADAELFGVALPRRQLVESRPGLAWIVDHRAPRLTQLVRCQTPASRSASPLPCEEASVAGSGGSSPRR